MWALQNFALPERLMNVFAGAVDLFGVHYGLACASNDQRPKQLWPDLSKRNLLKPRRFSQPSDPLGVAEASHRAKAGFLITMSAFLTVIG